MSFLSFLKIRLVIVPMISDTNDAPRIAPIAGFIIPSPGIILNIRIKNITKKDMM